MSIILYNGKILAESGIIEKGYIAIEDGKIVSIGSGDYSLQNLHPFRTRSIEKIDLKGLTVIPGFIDIHTHGLLDINVMEGEKKELEKLPAELVKFGVTGFLPTTMAYPIEGIINQVNKIREIQNNGRTLSQIILGVHLEGPWLSMKMRGAHNKEFVLVPQKEDVKRILEEIGDIVKTVTFSPEIENATWLAEELSSNGIIPVIGHTAATYQQTLEVIKAGARHVTHMFDAMLGYGENKNELGVIEPGVETAVLLNDTVSIELIGCPIHVPPPLLTLVDRIKPHDKKILVTDAGAGAGKPDGTIVELESGRNAYVKDGVLRLIDENDPRLNNGLAGSAVTMNVALKRLVNIGQLKIENAIQWATINPAKLLGIESITGSIRNGKRANLAVIDENFGVKITILNGEIVFRKEKS